MKTAPIQADEEFNDTQLEFLDMIIDDPAQWMRELVFRKSTKALSDTIRKKLRLVQLLRDPNTKQKAAWDEFVRRIRSRRIAFSKRYSAKCLTCHTWTIKP